MGERNKSADAPGGPVLLVAYDGGAMSETQLHLACRSANDIHGNVRVLHVIERPQQLPLDAPPTADENAELDRLQDRAERIAKRYGVRCTFIVEYARSVAETVVAEAVESKARVVFVGLRERRRPGISLMLSGTIRHILQHAPCAVQMCYLPAGLPEFLSLEDTDG
jgi:nucleotide-binding universal stress UspA family protein